MENKQQGERKNPKDMNRDELLIFVGQLMASAKRKSKLVKDMQIELDFLKAGKDKVNLHKVLAGSKLTKQTVKERVKGMPKQLKKLNGYFK